MSVASCLSWLRLLRVLTLSAYLGPLTLMMVRMLTDVGRLLIIESFIVIAFSSGVYVLYRAVDLDYSETEAAQTEAESEDGILQVIHPLHPLHDCEPMLDMYASQLTRAN